MKSTIITILVIVVVVIAAAVAGFFLYARHLKNESYSSGYQYQIDVDVGNNDVDEIILYVPYPTQDGQTPNENILETGYIPANWNISYIETEYGPMLSVSIANISSQQYAAFDIHSEETVNTKEPLGNDLMLYPKTDIQQEDCDFPYPESWEDRLKCYSYTGILYAEFDENYTDEIHISVELCGENTWWVFGWNGNEYTDRAYIEITDSQGWIETQGSMKVGMGNY